MNRREWIRCAMIAAGGALTAKQIEFIERITPKKYVQGGLIAEKYIHYIEEWNFRSGNPFYHVRMLGQNATTGIWSVLHEYDIPKISNGGWTKIASDVTELVADDSTIISLRQGHINHSIFPMGRL